LYAGGSSKLSTVDTCGDKVEDSRTAVYNPISDLSDGVASHSASLKSLNSTMVMSYEKCCDVTVLRDDYWMLLFE
jgi:hypothetical protein